MSMRAIGLASSFKLAMSPGSMLKASNPSNHPGRVSDAARKLPTRGRYDKHAHVLVSTGSNGSGPVGILCRRMVQNV